MPSVFAMAVVFGGGLGMTAAAAFGVDAGGGFILGATLVFMLLSVAVALSREIEQVERFTFALLSVAVRQALESEFDLRDSKD
jgi:hypothetical protein